MSELVQPETPVEPAPEDPAPTPKKAALPRGLVLAALVVLVAFIAVKARALVREVFVLQRELTRTRNTAVIGYPGITPRFSFAIKPDNWYHDEGEFTLIWGGWKQGVGHQWFRAGHGDVDANRLSFPMGRDVVQVIDSPLIESGGGQFWARVPDEASVVGERLGGVDSAYPILIMDKVLAVNDRIGDRAFLVTYSPMGPSDDKVHVYDPSVGGERLVMGSAGYLHDNIPMLYDRATESLWVHDGTSLLAIAGAHKGKRLPQVARLAPVTWGQWRSQHPTTRLLVGADRAQARL